MYCSYFVLNFHCFILLLLHCYCYYCCIVTINEDDKKLNLHTFTVEETMYLVFVCIVNAGDVECKWSNLYKILFNSTMASINFSIRYLE